MSDPFQKPDALYDLLSTCLRDANERGDRLAAENNALRAEIQGLQDLVKCLKADRSPHNNRSRTTADKGKT